MSLFSPAYAQSAGSTGADLLSFLPLLAVLLVMYVFFFRTQQKKDKQHKELMATLKRGDRVLTSGGLIGVVAKVGPDQEISLEVAPGVHVSFFKGMVTTVLGKESLKEASADDAPSALKGPASKSKSTKSKPINS